MEPRNRIRGRFEHLGKAFASPRNVSMEPRNRIRGRQGNAKAKGNIVTSQWSPETGFGEGDERNLVIASYRHVSMEPRNRIRGRSDSPQVLLAKLKSLNGAPKQDSGKG